jgi:anti-sigma factor RsiW
MTEQRCDTMHLLIQAEHDRELDAADAARVAAHLRTCTACTAQAAALRRLSAQLRAELPPAVLTLRLQATAARLAAPPRAAAWRTVRRQYPGFAAGLAIAASLALVVLPRRPADLADEAVTAHIRALQPGHLIDVISTDRHTVKPWFNGKLDFSPPVQDFAGIGFPLKGGRLDYLAGRPVAVLIYGRAQHMIDVTVWPGAPAPARVGTTNGYNYLSWSRNGMVFWAVSDLNKAELRDFTLLWH